MNIKNYSGVRKSSHNAQNEAAASSTSESVLAKWPETCLLVASWLGQIEIVKALLQRGTNISIRDGHGRLLL